MIIRRLPYSPLLPLAVFEALKYHDSPRAYWLDSSSGGRFPFFGAGLDVSDDDESVGRRATHTVTYRLGSGVAVSPETSFLPPSPAPPSIIDFLSSSLSSIATTVTAEITRLPP